MAKYINARNQATSHDLPKMNKQKLNATTIEQLTIQKLQKRIDEECPDRGYAPPLNQKVSFRSLPISEPTLRGLEEGDGKGNNGGNNNSNNSSNGGKSKNKKKANNFSNKKQFWTMTDIQNACIPHALKGRDILGAARTGRFVFCSCCSLFILQIIIFSFHSKTIQSHPFCFKRQKCKTNLVARH